ncbi:hypothetical protein PIB30_117493 [Stylosanthes scabra]|uniref:Uncharacterized protein n=1 Tax=Stylosanthes scabra TaxID=79078 RepID=A0ABU6UDH7_9FABA|nr:hypothetical protein [Stylosanthes scabra]
MTKTWWSATIRRMSLLLFLRLILRKLVAAMMWIFQTLWLTFKMILILSLLWILWSALLIALKQKQQQGYLFMEKKSLSEERIYLLMKDSYQQTSLAERWLRGLSSRSVMEMINNIPYQLELYALFIMCLFLIFSFIKSISYIFCYLSYGRL